MVARQLHHHPAWTAAGRAADLAAAPDRLELMATENLSVAAAFDLSYADLTGEQQRLFRRLGLHPGSDIDAYAAAALDGTDPGTARRGLEALYDHCLLTAGTGHTDPRGSGGRGKVRATQGGCGIGIEICAGMQADLAEKPLLSTGKLGVGQVESDRDRQVLGVHQLQPGVAAARSAARSPMAQAGW